MRSTSFSSATCQTAQPQFIGRDFSSWPLLVTFVLWSLLLVACPLFAQDVPWYDPAWTYRSAITVSPGLDSLGNNTCSSVCSNLQVNVILDSSFNFTLPLPNGTDVRVTDSDGQTLIPFWIESWNSTGQSPSASVWVNVPSLPAAGKTIYLYYANPNGGTVVPEATPPIGPFMKAAQNPIVPQGDPGNGASLLAENIVYDSVTGHYWMVFASYRSQSGVGLVWSDTPTVPTSWQWQGIISNLVSGSAAPNAPHLVQYNGTWYLFYSSWPNIRLATASSVTGPYTDVGNPVLSPVQGEVWEAARVDEPFVFQRQDGKWIMMFMGDSGGAHEQVSYAIADTIIGPYTQYQNGTTPWIPFGPTGSFDAGTVADPWVVYFNNTYYIGYTVSSTIYSPWQTALATTTDFQSFTKKGVVLPLSQSGWDSSNSFRGAVLRVPDPNSPTDPTKDIWVFSYTGDAYQMGIATQPVYMINPYINNPNLVFDFFDDFNSGTQPDSTKWNAPSTATATVAQGKLTLTPTSTTGKLIAKPTFGQNVVLETLARHDNADGSGKSASEVILGNSDVSNSLRILDYDNPNFFEYNLTVGGIGGGTFPSLGVALDSSSFLLHQIFWKSGEADFALNGQPATRVTTTTPTAQLGPMFFLYQSGITPTIEVDWVRVRKWFGGDATANVGSPENINYDHAPVANPDSYSTLQDTQLSVAAPGVLANDTDQESDPLSAVLVGATSHGVLHFSTNGSFTYMPNSGWYGTDTFMYQVRDIHNGTTVNGNSVTVTISVNQNLPSVAQNDEYSVVAGNTLTVPAPGVLANDSDAADEPLTASLVSQPTHGALTLNANGSFTYLSDPSFLGTDQFTYKANDGKANSNVATVYIVASAWLDPAWTDRRAVTVSNPCGQTCTNYQAQVKLTSSNFDFTKALGDGSDVRVSDTDGQTLIPFWIESWDTNAQTASLWVKIPSIPTAGTTIYLYYGNPSPPPSILPAVETPPAGPFTKNANPIFANTPQSGLSLLAENMVWAPDAQGINHWWLAFANYSDGTIGLAWSDKPWDVTSWNWFGAFPTEGGGSIGGNCPSLVRGDDGRWYVFYENIPDTMMAVSDNVFGPYTVVGPALSPAPNATWEAYRVTEPFVFKRNDGVWVMMYMGDSGGYHEQVNFATAPNVFGPYTEASPTPVLPFGPSGQYDAGTVADPWVVEYHGMYYVGNTVSPTIYSPWQTTLATTTDWQTFTKTNNIILPLGPDGWNSSNSFRGAVSRVAVDSDPQHDLYVFSYTGDGYRMGIATQPVYQSPPTIINNPEAVFDFYDGFEGATLDSAKWAVANTNTTGSVDVSNGIMTLTGVSGGSYGYTELIGTSSQGVGSVLEERVRHVDAGLSPGSEPNAVAEVGFSPGGLANVIRVLDFPDLAKYSVNVSAGGSNPNYSTTQISFDANWHNFRISRKPDSTVDFFIDDVLASTASGSNVPTGNLPPWLMSFANPPVTQNRVQADWVRLRRSCGQDPNATVNGEESANHPPVAQNLNLTTNQDMSLPITLVATDQDNDSLVYNIVTGPSQGTLSAVVGNLVTYTPNPSFVGIDSLTYTAYDGKATSTPATVTINVLPATGMITTPAKGSILAGSTVTFSWTAENGATDYQLWLGSSPGGHDLAVIGTSQLSGTAGGLPTDGSRIYATLYGYANGTWTMQDSGSYTALNLVKATITDPSKGSTLAGSTVTFSWTAESGATDYQLWLGTSPGEHELAVIGTSQLSGTAGGLPTDGSTVYATLYGYANGTWAVQDSGSYTANTTVKAVITTPAKGSTLAGSTVTFNWTPETGATDYQLWLGSSPGGHELAVIGTSQLSGTAGGLPTDGSQVYATLYGYANGTWTAQDAATYTAFQ